MKLFHAQPQPFSVVSDDADHEEHSDTPPETLIFSAFRDDLARLAERLLPRFFRGKRLRNGLPVPRSLLVTPENIALMIDGEFVDRVDQIYQELGTFGVDEHDPSGNVSWDTRFLLDTLRECADLGIPKPLAAGVVLIYTRLCVDVNQLRSPKDLAG